MGEQNVSLSILTNPVSLRYAIDFDEYQVFQSNTPTCYLFVPLEGPLIMHGATRKDFPNVLEYRRPNFISPFDSGLDLVVGPLGQHGSEVDDEGVLVHWNVHPHVPF